ncbi:MAG: formate dehydrogenase subunit alpha [Planctomycetales bacterium]|nr:formate dehydrogenase subunit alpha [Planctomycetales bacterium]
MIRVELDGQQIDVSPGTTVYEAAEQLGMRIPTLCHHADLSPVGSCRMCLVEIEGWDRPQTSCNLPCTDGMKITTSSNSLQNARQSMLRLLLEHYHDAASDNSHRPQTEFERLVEEYDAQNKADPSCMQDQQRYPIDADDNPFIRIDLNQCILCTKCVRACSEIQGRFVWSVAERGDQTRIVCGTDQTMLQAGCESCGACAAYCPTGALADRMAFRAGKPDRLVRTTCSYCGVGCQFDLNVKDERIIQVTSAADAPVNGMAMCVKGRYGYDFVHHSERLTRPQVRQYLLQETDWRQRPADRGPWVEVDWEVALDVTSRKLAEIWQESGGQAMGVLSSAKCTNEENYLMQKFARQILRTNNVDHCARLCHSSTVAGLAMAMGSGAMSNSMQDIAENAAAILITGSNTTEQHPVFGAMLRQAALRGCPIVVADPRRIDIAEFAVMHLRQKPGTDVALINGLMHLALENGWHDADFIRQRCEGFDELQAVVQNYSPNRVAEITGISEADLLAAAELLCTAKPMAVIWAMGITQHTTGVSNVLSLANLQMLLGNMGVPGGGVNPLRGQNNVQGACDMGALPNVFPGYQRVDDTGISDKFASAWDLQAAEHVDDSNRALDQQPGLTVTELVNGGQEGRIRSLYILGEDPAMTEPDSNHAKACLAATEFIVLQEIFPSETSEFADVLLPGATFAEKEGNFTNTERRVQPIQLAVPAPGEALPDWLITSRLANQVLERTGRTPLGEFAAWRYAKAADVLREINSLTPSYQGITPERIAAGESLQWPVTDANHPGTPILHVGKFTRGLGKFHAVDYLPAVELPNDEFPLLLTTGRVLYHWHGGEMTRRAAGLTAVCPEPLVEISPDDAAKHAIANGDWITLESRRGTLHARACVTNRVAAGVVFGNFHFPQKGNVNNLTIGALDPVAKIPEYKVCAVRFAGSS